MNPRNPKRHRDRTRPAPAAESTQSLVLGLQRRALGQLADGIACEAVGASILRDIQAASGRSHAVLLGIDPKAGRYFELARSGGSDAIPVPLHLGAGTFGEALASRRAAQGEHDGAALAAIPLLIGADVAGVVGLMSSSTRLPDTPSEAAFDEQQLADLESMVSALGLVVHRALAPFGGGRSASQVLHAQRLESIGALAGGVAHDFNNLLGVILGYVELGAMKLVRSGGPSALPHLEAALATLSRARSLADLLLDFSEPRRETSDVCDPNEIVHQTRDLLAETLDRRIRFEVSAAREVPACPLGAIDLRQLLTNLCLNAAHAMPEGGTLTVETCTRRIAAGEEFGILPGKYVGIRVIDTGPGVPPDLQKVIFQPGFTTRKQTGTGLGLWVVRTLANSVGGHVSVTSSHSGASFSVWLPNALTVHRRTTVPGTPSRAPVDVLIVDDEAGVRDVTREVLELAGYTVRAAATGGEAVEILRSEPGGFRLILLDNHLGDIRGVDLLDVIDALPYTPKIVIVTGRPGEPELRDLSPDIRILTKPYLQRHLAALLHDIDMQPVTPQP